MSEKSNKRFFKLSGDFIDNYLPMLSTNAVVLYIFLAQGVNEEKNGDLSTWPSYETIMEKTGIKSKPRISRTIDELVEYGLITRIEKKYPNSLTSPNAYFMNMDFVGDQVNDYLKEYRKQIKAKRSEAAKKSIQERKNKVSDAPAVTNQNYGELQNETTVSNESKLAVVSNRYYRCNETKLTIVTNRNANYINVNKNKTIRLNINQIKLNKNKKNYTNRGASPRNNESATPNFSSQEDSQNDDDIWAKKPEEPKVEYASEALRRTAELSGNKPKTEQQQLEEFEKQRKIREEAMRELRAKKAKEVDLASLGEDTPQRSEYQEDFYGETITVVKNNSGKFVKLSNGGLTPYAEYVELHDPDNDDESDLPF